MNKIGRPVKYNEKLLNSSFKIPETTLKKLTERALKEKKSKNELVINLLKEYLKEDLKGDEHEIRTAEKV